MKKILITVILMLSCIGVFSQTALNPSGTWTAARNIINANFSDTYDSLAVHQLRLSAVDDSIASHLLRLIAVEDSIGELRISIGSGTGTEVDSSIYATRHYTSSTFATIANPVFTGVQKVSTTDTLATQAYARSYGGTGTVTVGNVRDEIADSLNALRPAMLVGDGTVGPFFDGSSDGGQMLYFYGDNGFYTALQGGAPTANRSYRLPIAALPSAGTTSLMNIDEYGNMGFVASTTYAPLNSPNFTGVPLLATSDTLSTRAYARSVSGSGGVTLETVQGEISDSLNARIGAGVELSDIAQMLSDTTLFFAPMIGVGQANDTTLFSTGDIIYGFRWGGSCDLILTSVTGVVFGTTPDIDIAILKDVNYRDATPTEVLSADLTITSTTTGNTATSFSSGTIVPGDYVWIRVDQCTAQPTQCLISIYGYLQR